jgi:hypothetical protein
MGITSLVYRVGFSLDVLLLRSSVKLCVSLIVADCYCDWWNDILLQSFNVFLPPEISVFYELGYFCFFSYVLTSVVPNSWNKIGIFIKNGSS